MPFEECCQQPAVDSGSLSYAACMDVCEDYEKKQKMRLVSYTWD